MKTSVLAVALSSLAVVAAIAGFTLARAGDEQQKTEPLSARLVSSAEEKIEAALGEPTEIDIFEKPLQTVADHFRNKHKINILIDTVALEAIGIGADEPVTLSLSGISLQSALNIILRNLDLTCTIRDEVLLVTTWDEAENDYVTRVYDVTDLVTSQDKTTDLKTYQEQPGAVWADCDTLINLITSTIEPDQWDEQPQIETIQVRGVDLLVISQTRQIHREIRRLLDELRTIARKTGIDEKRKAEPRSAGFVSPAEEKIEAALREPTEIDVVEEPLQTVVDHFRKKHKINILIDRPALVASGVATDEPVTLTLSGVSLQSALNIILRRLDLTWMIRDEVLMITTADEAEANLVTRVYDVSDLVTFQDPSGEVWTDPDALMNVITTTVEPDAWDGFGGPGTIESISVQETTAFVVRQTHPIHWRIERLLDQLRVIAPDTGADGPPVREKPMPYDAIDTGRQEMGGGFGGGKGDGFM